MDTLSCLALTFTPGLGNTSIRRLVDLYPDDDIFSLPRKELETTFSTHREIAERILAKSAFARAEQELRFCESNKIRPIFFTEPDFPQRLNQPETADCPALLYRLGCTDLNSERQVAIVGTRRATHTGIDNTDRIVHGLKPYGTPIVSGLAYGIDSAAHKAAVDHGLPTVAVLGHGLDRLYPASNRPLARSIIETGGALVTEYPSGTAINPRYFPARNRIIAALADATVVVEASEKGGALITAAIAGSYQREVFAIPGRLDDTYSKGTNNLIATNRALLLRTASDIAHHMGWPAAAGQQADSEKDPPSPLSPDEKRILTLLSTRDALTLAEIADLAAIPLPKAAALLFNLEMTSLVHALPGHLYTIAHK